MLKMNFPGIKKNQISVYYFDYGRYKSEMEEFRFKPTVLFKTGRLTSNGLVGNPNNKSLFYYFTSKLVRTNVFEPFHVDFPREALPVSKSPALYNYYKDFVEIDDDLVLVVPEYSTIDSPAHYSWKSLLEREEKLSSTSSVCMDSNFTKYVNEIIYKKRMRDQKIKTILS